jgi:hypothetical protein
MTQHGFSALAGVLYLLDVSAGPHTAMTPPRPSPWSAHLSAHLLRVVVALQPAEQRCRVVRAEACSDMRGAQPAHPPPQLPGARRYCPQPGHLVQHQRPALVFLDSAHRGAGGSVPWLRKKVSQTLRYHLMPALLSSHAHDAWVWLVAYLLLTHQCRRLAHLSAT